MELYYQAIKKTYWIFSILLILIWFIGKVKEDRKEVTLSFKEDKGKINFDLLSFVGVIVFD